MLIELIATIVAGFGAAGVALIARWLSGGRIGRWVVPTAAGLGLIGFAVWNEYSWYPRVAGVLPEGVTVLGAPAESSPLRPWTYLFPVTTRFMALDATTLARHPADPALRLADLVFVTRWEPVRRIPMVFDCREGLRADLMEGAALSPEGRLLNGAWGTAPEGDALQTAACAGWEGDGEG